MTRLILLTHNLSVANIGSESRDLPERFDRDSEENYEIILPSITLAHIRERGEDIFLDFYNDRSEGDEQPLSEDSSERDRAIERFITRLAADEDLFNELVDLFRESDAYGEWRDSYEPIMNFYWPVSPAYRVESQAAADLIDEHAAVCTLVRFGEDDFGLALSGGGMDLSDKIAGAYLCCGVVPPVTLLTGLRGVIDASYLAEIDEGLRLAYDRAAEYLSNQVERLGEVAGQLFEEREAVDA